MQRSIDVVIGDVHGRADALRALLREIGVVDSRGRRRTAGCVLQGGDLLDRKAGPEANLDTAKVAAQALDIVLVGNHEWRILCDGDHDHDAALEMLAGRGWPLAAAALDGWLVTHAGVHPKLARELPSDVEECAAEINRRWQRDPKRRARDKLFAAVGPARGGSDPYGGILWLH